MKGALRERRGINRLFHCGCCAPPRQIFYRAQSRHLDSVHHEDDDTPAVAPVSLAQRKRIMRGQ